MNKDKNIYVVESGCAECFKEFNEALAAESSDRARLIIAAAWIDAFLRIKLQNEFSKGNAASRKILFSENGPLTFSTKLNIAYCAGWIDSDVYHDVTVIRKLRNKFAHTIDRVSLNDSETGALLQSFLVPHREFHDWGKLKASATSEGVILYTGDKPKDAKENVCVPGFITFKVAIPLILSVLVSNLGILFKMKEEGWLSKVGLPKHQMKNDSP